MVSSMIDWINSGFQGSPAFVQDLGGFLLQAADEAFGRFIKDGSFICSPFRLDVQIAVAIEYDQSRTNEPPTCTISGIFKNFESFIDGEFSQGGWDDWFKITSNPAVYTEYGSVLTAKATARARVINAKGEEFNILGFGDGFLSGKVCQNVTGPDGVTEECAIVKPGKTIADALNKALGAGQDTLVTADEISEIIAALLGQLANKAISGAAGLLGLSGGTGYTYQGYSRGSFAEELRSGASNTTGGVDTGTGVPTGGGTTNPGDISFATNYLADSLSNQESALTRVDDYINKLQAVASNPLNNAQVKISAQVALTEALAYKDRMIQGIQSAGPIVTEYTTLETEYAGADTTRRIEIRTRQSELVQDFNSVGLVSEVELNSVFARWDTIISQNVGPIITTCTGYVDLNGNGIWDTFEDDADCNGVADIDEISIQMCNGLPC